MNTIEKVATAILTAGLTLVFLPIISALLAVPVYFLWNGLCPHLFNLSRVTFLQAWGLNILSSFLVKGAK